MLGSIHTNVMHNIKILRGEYTVTKQEIYNTIVSLTAEIKATDLGAKLFEAAKVDGNKVKEVAETFMSEYPELYQKMCNFADEYNELIDKGIDIAIFGPEEDKEREICVFNPDLINASSFFALAFLTNIDDGYLFTGEFVEKDENHYLVDGSTYLDALEEESDSTYLAEFLGDGFDIITEEHLKNLAEDGFNYSNIYDLLADVFAGKLKEYVG